MSSKNPSLFLAARCSKKLKRRVINAEKSTLADESDFIRVAVEEFFINHPTPTEQLAAVRKSKLAAGK